LTGDFLKADQQIFQSYSPKNATNRSTGYPTFLFARAEFHELLLSKIPPEKIFMNKKIKSIQQNANGAMIRCTDNTNYRGDIIVGADGAYSSVRQNLYRMLNAKGKLPKSDNVDLPFNSVCLVGQTTPLDPEVFTHLKDSHTWFETMVSPDKPYAVSVFLFFLYLPRFLDNDRCSKTLERLMETPRWPVRTVHPSRQFHASTFTHFIYSHSLDIIVDHLYVETEHGLLDDDSGRRKTEKGVKSEMVAMLTGKILIYYYYFFPLQNLDEISSKANDSFRNSEWGPEAAEAMCKDVRDFPVARNNMTMGDLIDKTPKDLISKVMLEEKLFDTWHGDRIVLLGDGNFFFFF